MREYFFRFFKYVGKAVSGKGLANLPFATVLYQALYRCLKPRGIVEISAGGHTLFVNSRDTGSAPYLIMHGQWDPPQTEVFEKLLKPGMTFVDVGANIGYFTLLAARAVGSTGRVVAFEPDRGNFSLLQNNVERNGYQNVELVQEAVSDKAGTATFYLKKENLSAHSLVREENTTEVQVETVSLDEFFKNKPIPDVIKIDVEGAEPAVLIGMHDILAKSEKMAVITEFYPRAIASFGYAPEAYLRAFTDVGFLLYRLAEQAGVAPVAMSAKDIAEASAKTDEKFLLNILCLKNWDYRL